MQVLEVGTTECKGGWWSKWNCFFLHSLRHPLILIKVASLMKYLLSWKKCIICSGPGWQSRRVVAFTNPVCGEKSLPHLFLRSLLGRPLEMGQSHEEQRVQHGEGDIFLTQTQWKLVKANTAWGCSFYYASFSSPKLAELRQRSVSGSAGGLAALVIDQASLPDLRSCRAQPWAIAYLPTAFRLSFVSWLVIPANRSCSSLKASAFWHTSARGRLQREISVIIDPESVFANSLLLRVAYFFFRQAGVDAAYLTANSQSRQNKWSLDCSLLRVVKERRHSNSGNVIQRDIEPLF